MNTFKFTMLGLMTAIGIGVSAERANAQIIPGWGYNGPQIVRTGTAVTPGIGVSTVTNAYDPIWGTQSYYRGYVNPYTGASFERRVIASPFGGYSTVMVNNPTILPYPYPYNPYWNPYYYPTYYTWPYYGVSPQMAAYYQGVYGRNRFVR
jgi:hypothetical protein